MAVILEDCRPTPKVLLKHFLNCSEYIILDIFVDFIMCFEHVFDLGEKAKDLSEPSPLDKEGAS